MAKINGDGGSSLAQRVRRYILKVDRPVSTDELDAVFDENRRTISNALACAVKHRGISRVGRGIYAPNGEYYSVESVSSKIRSALIVGKEISSGELMKLAGITKPALRFEVTQLRKSGAKIFSMRDLDSGETIYMRVKK
ncbi:hypothetical protein NVP1189B_55 [Vibrio phage 1.189.B._10N.286.51.B5]|nr:hypothetical protein NVP1189B_55 [Vibrio phage 1.189.B._10N.286.51.B5]AUR93947.1 hypothetical protein NVP1189C_55 [Vibrio phage 1.189.C._10N.286.51.B5]AUR94013.1 hypothetical protein NVP1189O_55 [Vibrio phage 1.189.O._10N.286.51.B5]